MLQQYLKYGRLEAGCDEAGRGCLAGPVFAAAVILPENYVDEYLNDSKKLSEHQRDKLRPTGGFTQLIYKPVRIQVVCPAVIRTCKIFRLKLNWAKKFENVLSRQRGGC